MIIRELGEGDALAYRTLRLRALKEHPTAFISSYEQQREWPLETFAKRLLRTFDSADSFNLGCFVEGNLVGTVGFFRHDGPKRMHIGAIVGMHVAAEQQGRGYGRALLDAALNRARRMPGLAVIHLGGGEHEPTCKVTVRVLRLRDLRRRGTGNLRRWRVLRRRSDGIEARPVNWLRPCVTSPGRLAARSRWCPRRGSKTSSRLSRGPITSIRHP